MPRRFASVLELLGRVDSREAEVLLQGVEQLRSSLLQTDSDELLDTGGVDRLEVVVEQFVNRTEWIQTKVAGSSASLS